MKTFILILIAMLFAFTANQPVVMAEDATLPWYIETYKSDTGWKPSALTQSFANSTACIQMVEYIVTGKYGNEGSVDPNAHMEELKNYRCVNATNPSEIVYSTMTSGSSSDSPQGSGASSKSPLRSDTAPQAVNGGFTALAPIPGLTDANSTSLVNSATLANFFNNFYKYLIGIAAILALFEIIYGGVEIALNQESVSTLMNEKSRIRNAILGLVLVLTPVLVFSIINPSILSLSLNLPSLQTASRVQVSSNFGESAPIPTNVLPASDTECRTVSTNEYFENAVCPSKDLAFAYQCKNGGTLVARFKTLTCQKWDPNTQKCLDEFPVQCMGNKTAKVLYYAPASTIKDFLGLNFGRNVIKIVPRDAPILDSFSSGCSAAGGKPYHTMVSGTAADCPSDAQLPIVNTENQAAAYKCASFTLSCTVYSD